MDYSKFRIKACVDWIDLEVQTQRPTNFQAVQRRLKVLLGLPGDKVPYVEAQDAGDGSAATVFRCRIHDPACWHDLDRMMRDLGEQLPLVGEPRVAAIEIALDAYSKGAGRDELIELTSRYYRFHTHPTSENRRFAGKCKGDTKGKGVDNYSPENARRMLADGRVIIIGNKSDDLSQRIYFKTTDKGGLPIADESKRRARVEVTVQGDAIPISTWGEWASFRFERKENNLSRFFTFRKDRNLNSLSPLHRIILERRPQIGERKEQRRSRKGGGQRWYNSETVADTELNKRARDALRNLSGRWGK